MSSHFYNVSIIIYNTIYYNQYEEITFASITMAAIFYTQDRGLKTLCFYYSTVYVATVGT